jgi:hypothetical protein
MIASRTFRTGLVSGCPDDELIANLRLKNPHEFYSKTMLRPIPALARRSVAIGRSRNCKEYNQSALSEKAIPDLFQIPNTFCVK